MLLNYFRIALRNLVKHKVYTFINVTGLSVGIACCLFIALFIQNETSYDKFFDNGDRIYRVRRIGEMNGEKVGIPYVAPPYAPALRNDFPDEIVHAVRVMPEKALVTYGDKSFQENRVTFADSTFFEVFSYPLLQGDPRTVLDKPNSLVVTQAVARKYFGNADPVGKVLDFDNGTYLYEVTGVMAPLPGNAHLDFDFLASTGPFANKDFFKSWGYNSLATYVLLAEKTSVGRLEARFPAFLEKYMADYFKASGRRTEMRLQPLSDIYFGQHLGFDPSLHGDLEVIYLFATIALFILAIACINFMNLSTARSAGRAKEVGMRKVMGAFRTHLIAQFLGESLLLALLGVALALMLVFIGLPQFSAFLGKPLALPLNQLGFWVLLAGIVVVVGVLAGTYPAFFLSAFQPIRVLKGRFTASRGSTWLRKGLVVVQFGISVLLVVSTFIIVRQLDYVQAKKLGYDKEHTLLVRISNGEIADNRQSFINDVKRIARVQEASAMSGEPGGFHDGLPFEVEGKAGDPWQLRMVFTDPHYVKTMGLTVIAGRDLSENYRTDALEGMLLNRAAVKKLGWSPQEALGKTLKNKMVDSLPRRVVGVVEDFHFSSLKEEIQPLAISPGLDNRVIAIKLAAGNPQEAIRQVEASWRKIAPKYPFTYEFLDQVYDNLYKAEQKQRTILGIFAGIAILVACLGLFGLAAFTAEQRTKEVSVRKVLGASVGNVVLLLSKDFVKLVLVAIALAVPLAWYLMHQWLEDFVYRIAIGPDVFLLAGGMAVGIALLTVSYHAIRTALSNPAKTLRSE
ncbi:MAG: ABC transporter permease [Cytophagales bacterium]|nr:ABC transporter permease [Cytophagales bacterium]